MPTPITREEFLAHAQPIQDDVKEIVSLLREQTAHVNSLDKRLAVLEDRQPTRQAAQWGAFSGSLAAVIIAVINALLR